MISGRAASWPRYAAAAAAAAAAMALGSISPLREPLFTAPAARLAALLSGASCAREAGGYVLAARGLDLCVIPACAASDFFWIVAGFLAFLFAAQGRSWRWQAAVLPAAWAATIASNAARLLAAWEAGRWARATLSPSLWPAVHFSVGIATFLLALTAVYAGVTRGLPALALALERKRHGQPAR